MSRVSRAVSAVMICKNCFCFSGSATRPSASSSENKRMLVSGVFNSCETLLTKSVFCRASASCRCKSATMSALPSPMASTSTPINNPNVSRSVRAD